MASIPSHAPMSERQQLALIKKLEKEAAMQAEAAASPSTSPSTVTPHSRLKLTSGTGHGRTMFILSKN